MLFRSRVRISGVTYSEVTLTSSNSNYYCPLKDPTILNMNQNVDVGNRTGTVPILNDRTQGQFVALRAPVCIHVLQSRASN